MNNWLTGIKDACDLYMLHGSRSNKKVDCLHATIKAWLVNSLPAGYTVETEQNVSSLNPAHRKKCDLVIFQAGLPVAVFPVKFSMSNYHQNINNMWEGLTGECAHLKWANPALKICPINIIFQHVPYLDTKGLITRFETITPEEYSVNQQLVQQGLCTDVLNYIIQVQHSCAVGQPYNQTPTILGFHPATPFRDFAALKLNPA